MDPLKAMQNKYPDIKTAYHAGMWVIYDKRNTPFWLAYFNSPLDAYIAWDTYQQNLAETKEV